MDKVQTKLRKHYERPKFLPDDSESSSLDWIFMGGSGTGAMMHVSLFFTLMHNKNYLERRNSGADLGFFKRWLLYQENNPKGQSKA